VAVDFKDFFALATVVFVTALAPVVFDTALAPVVFDTLLLLAFAWIFFALAVFLGFPALLAEEAARPVVPRRVAGAALAEPESESSTFGLESSTASHSSTAVVDLLFFVVTRPFFVGTPAVPRLAVPFVPTFRLIDDFGF